MQDHERQHRSSTGFIAGIFAAMVTAGTVSTWWAIRSLSNYTDIPAPTPRESPISQPSAKKGQAQVYWLDSRDDLLQLQESPLTFSKSLTEQEILETAVKDLLSGPQSSEHNTTIPPNTRLLSLKLEDNGVLIDLSSEFTTGGGSASMKGRLAQLLYTATSLHGKGQVWLSVEGEPLKLLGGEGLMVEQPMTRGWFEENFEL
ncbi:GerMN domain-containing protein [Crocosphaera sp.]|uniref:GerMN domain-containing protein n=1 Tax=Crocosphaera sp. TaxID=2729996 RepID=UPI00262D1BF1|nr:GerMN domain-containing protein [Crocosphaera sp.]MDJ0579700.1 GerMN domain-containing protein [Crocosphaera sp.]